jgi:4-carboxymuconolactone decarboxylase
MRTIVFIALMSAAFCAAWGQSAPQPGAAPHGTPVALEVVLPSPATAAALGRIEEYLWKESNLGPRVAGLLALITAREMSLAYEWSQREDAALQAGLEPAVVETVRRNAPLTELAPDDALLVDFGRQLFRQRHVDSQTFAALVSQFGKQGAFDAIMLLAYPTMAGMLQRAADLKPPASWNADRLPRIAGVGTPAGKLGEFVAMGERPPLPSDVNEDSTYRFPLLRRQELDARSREIFDRVVGADHDTVPRGPVGMTFLSAQLVEPIQQLNTALREKGALETRLVEIVIATTGREMNSQYQWIVHGGAAERAGAGKAVLDAIRDDRDLGGLDERDVVAITLVRELFREGHARPATLAAAVRHFGNRGAVEIAALAGDYLMITTVYNALGMRLRADQTPTLPHRSGAPVGAEWR